MGFEGAEGFGRAVGALQSKAACRGRHLPRAVFAAMSGHDAHHSAMGSSADRDVTHKGRLLVMVVLAYTIAVTCSIVAFISSLVIGSDHSGAAAPPPHAAHLGLTFPAIVLAAWLMFSPVMLVLFVLLVIFERSIRRHSLIWSVSAIVFFDALLGGIFRHCRAPNGRNCENISSGVHICRLSSVFIHGMAVAARRQAKRRGDVKIRPCRVASNLLGEFPCIGQ